MILLLIVINILLGALISSFVGSKRKIGGNWSMFWCLIFGPLIGLIITLCSDKK